MRKLSPKELAKRYLNAMRSDNAKLYDKYSKLLRDINQADRSVGLAIEAAVDELNQQRSRKE